MRVDVTSRSSEGSTQKPYETVEIFASVCTMTVMDNERCLKRDGTYTGTGSGKHDESVVGTIVYRGGCIFVSSLSRTLSRGSTTACYR